MASYSVNDRAVERARRLIDARQYVLESQWGEAHELLQLLDDTSA